MPLETDILILGAGPTGLGAAWRLSQLGHRDWLLCEAAAEAGGLASSVTDEHGFTWDLGGHVQFSHYDYFDDLMDELLGVEGWLYHERESWVWLRDTFVPYPFQLNLHRLPLEERWFCVRGLLRLQPNGAPKNFGEWIDAVFGEGIATIFMRPYNFKVWAYPPEELSRIWIGERVATVDVERVIENVMRQRDDVSWGPNNQFRFPKHGGTGAVWRTLANKLETAHPAKLKMRHTLTKLDTENHIAYFANGERIRYRRLLNTIPLDTLVRLSDLADELGDAANLLRHSSTHIIGVALHGEPAEALYKKCWMYFPESDSPFYRATVFSHYSPNNVPDINLYWSLMVEVSESAQKPVNRETIIEETIQGLLNTKLIADRDAVHHTWYRRLEHGYPTPSLRRDEALNQLLPAFAERDVLSRGRFGAWKYEVSNQDHSFAQGVEAAEFWLTGTPEQTVNDPERVNAHVSRRNSRNADILSATQAKAVLRKK